MPYAFRVLAAVNETYMNSTIPVKTMSNLLQRKAGYTLQAGVGVPHWLHSATVFCQPILLLEATDTSRRTLS